jgi:hypothetical protein
VDAPGGGGGIGRFADENVGAAVGSRLIILDDEGGSGG